MINSTLIQCTLPSATVGEYSVSVTLNERRSASSAVLHRLCPRGQFASSRLTCGPCPKVVPSTPPRTPLRYVQHARKRMRDSASMLR